MIWGETGEVRCEVTSNHHKALNLLTCLMQPRVKAELILISLALDVVAAVTVMIIAHAVRFGYSGGLFCFGRADSLFGYYFMCSYSLASLSLGHFTTVL